MHILGLFLLCLILYVSSVRAAIEVYSAGKRFDSFEEYQKVDRNSLLPSVSLVNVMLDSVPVAVFSEEDQQKINQISYDDDVNNEIIDLEEQWPQFQFKHVFSRQEIEAVLRESLQNQSEPVLLISDPKKMRILSYRSQKENSPLVD